MSSITIEELKKLPAESYQIIDVRDEIEISHGAVKGALACKPEEIMENPEVDKTRKLVICCSRGINSKEIAKKLEISEDELMRYHEMPKCTEKFRSQEKLYNMGIRLYERLGIEKRIRK